MQLLRRRAKVVLVGFFGGELKLNLITMPTRAYRLIGSYTGSITDLIELVSLAKRGVIKPIISNRFKLNQATEALTMLKNGKILGRGIKSLKEKGAELKTIYPATEDILNTYTIMTKEEINAAAKKARDAYKEWKKDSDRRIDGRKTLHDFAQELRKNKEELARTATNELGKAIKEADQR